MKGRISDFHLEQYLLGEAPPWVSEAIAADPEAKARLEALKTDNEAFFTSYPPQQMVASIERIAAESEEEQIRRANEPRRRRDRGHQRIGELLRRLTPAPLVAFGAVAALAVVLLLPMLRTASVVLPEPATADELVRLKGLEPSLSVYLRESGGEVRELASGDPAGAGDSLQIAYNAAGASHGVILSVDGRGAVTLHFPATPFEAENLESGGEVPLSFSYILDDAPRFERFFFVAATGPLDVAAIVNATEELVDLQSADAVTAERVAEIAASRSNLDPGEVGVETVAVDKQP